MKTLIFASILLISFINVNAQEIGELAPEKEPMVFPYHAYGIDIMFSEAGFGLGTFFRSSLSNQKITFFADFSISESKDEKEFEYVDIFGQPIPQANKVNRIFLLPLNFGMQYRFLENVVYDNLRPYINFGVGPTFVVTTPYEKEFFSSFGSARMKYAAGGYVGLGANFGIDRSSLVGINLRYYLVHFFDEGVENMQNRFRKDLGGFYLTINIGIMY